MSALIAVAGRIGAAGKVSRIEIAYAGLRYLDAVIRAGGEPVTLTPRSLTAESARSLLSRFDGLVLMGGADVDPALYGQDPHQRTYGVDRRNDEFEIALARAAAQDDVPVLALCRGMQVANVAFGGTLHQHLDDVETEVNVAHGPAGFPKPTEGVEHPIDIAPGSLLAKALDGYREVTDRAAKNSRSYAEALAARARSKKERADQSARLTRIRTQAQTDLSREAQVVRKLNAVCHPQ